MPITYASHTPAHIAALFDTVIAQLGAQVAPEASLVLCTSLPESIDPQAHYICLNADAQHAADARISTITPPVSLAQLLTRIHALATTPSAVLTLAGGWKFSLHARLLEHADQAAVALTELEAALLAHLAQHDGGDISRESLMRDIWHYDETTQTHTLETHMYRLRGKLEKLVPAACTIETTDTGYRLAIS